MLDRIPLDIFYLIAADIKDLDTLKSLSTVSKAVHQALIPFLYRKLIIFAREHQLDRLFLPRWVQDDLRKSNTGRLSFVKEVEVVAPIHHRILDRCYADPNLSEHDMICLYLDIETTHLGHLRTQDVLTKTLETLFASLAENALRAFSFHLGCCFPNRIFNVPSIASKSLAHLESLSLITDGMCPEIMSRENTQSVLPVLKQLRHLSWRGIGIEDGPDIRKLLNANNNRLESLELEALYDEEDDIPPISVFLGTKRLTALRYMSISRIALGPNAELREALDLSQLRSLKLLSCRDFSPNFIEEIPSPRPVPKLKSLEIDLDPEDDTMIGSRGVYPLIPFLKSFVGLEELYISMSQSATNFSPLFDAIVRHKMTLRRLVIRHKTDETYANIPYLQDYVDMPLDHIAASGMSPLPIFRDLHLESIGLYINPTQMKELSGSLTATEQTFKFLHLRISGSDKQRWQDIENEWPGIEGVPPRKVLPIQELPTMFRYRFDGNNTAPRDPHKPRELGRFLNWAFGPTGFPNILIVAVGDFTHNSRFYWTNGLFCRNGDSDGEFQPSERIPSVEDDDGMSNSDFEEGAPQDKTGSARRSFRRMRPTDEGLWDRIKGAKEMLGVLPSQPILDWYALEDQQ